MVAYDLTDGKARRPLVAIIIFISIAFVTTIMRLLSRRVRKMPLGIDDYLMLAGLFFECVNIGLQFACVIAGGVGRHTADIAPEAVVKTLKIILPFEALYGITLMFVKSSMVFFYLRIFGTKRAFRISAYATITFIVLWAISVVLETFLLCRPLAYNWDQTIKGTCGDRNTVYVSAGALNIVSDFMVLALPIPHIWDLQLPLARKLGLVAMFSLGIFITVISIIRLKSLQAISFADPTYTLPLGLLWSTLEPCLGIINANLPMCRPYLATLFPNIFGTTRNRATSNTDPNKAYERSKGSRGLDSSFQRIEEGSYPLTRVDVGGVKNEISVMDTKLYEVPSPPGSTGDGDSREMDMEREREPHLRSAPSGIMIKREWNVDSR